VCFDKHAIAHNAILLLVFRIFNYPNMYDKTAAARLGESTQEKLFFLNTSWGLPTTKWIVNSESCRKWFIKLAGNFLSDGNL